MQCRTSITWTGSGGGLATWETVRLLDSVSRFPLLVLAFARGHPRSDRAARSATVAPRGHPGGRGLATASPRPPNVGKFGVAERHRHGRAEWERDLRKSSRD